MKKSGIELIAEERLRQVEIEGWTEQHDVQEHENQELLKAAICYAKAGFEGEDVDKIPKNNKWPWERIAWKPKNANSTENIVRNLTKAGALIAAEIDRLQKYNL